MGKVNVSSISKAVSDNEFTVDKMFDDKAFTAWDGTKYDATLMTHWISDINDIKPYVNVEFLTPFKTIRKVSLVKRKKSFCFKCQNFYSKVKTLLTVLESHVISRCKFFIGLF